MKRAKYKRKYENTLNVFTFGYLPWSYPSNWVGNICAFFRNIKRAWQRVTKGYCDWDLWDLDVFYVDLIKNSLDEFAERTNSYPDQSFASFEEWQEFLRDIAKRLNDFAIDNDKSNKYYSSFMEIVDKNLKNDPDKSEEASEIIDQYFTETLKIEKDKEELIKGIFFDLATYMRHLWI